MNLEVLKKIGLSEGEVKVYSALLEIGVTSINNIHERVGMDRRNIYDVLNKLIERGLVSYIETDGKRTFKISSPDKILSYIEEKRSALDSVKKEVSEVIPQIQEIFSSKKEEFSAEIFRGVEGVKAVWDDMLNYSDSYWLGSGFYIPDKFPAFWNDWIRRRDEKGVRTYHLFRYEKKKDVIERPKAYTSAKILPPEFSGNPTVTVIYGNKVAQMLLGDNLYVFVIESKELADNYKKYHKFLWDTVAKRFDE